MIRDRKILVPLLAALAVMLAVWLLPLPPLVASDDEFAEARMPQTRQEVEGARSAFVDAQAAYREYISSHDLGALRLNTEKAIARAQAAPVDAQALSAVNAGVEGIEEYTVILRRYAETSERYLDALRHYDDELMAWTRALRAASESLRDETWPIVEHLKRYPKPLGLAVDPSGVTSYHISLTLDDLRMSRGALSSRSEIGGFLASILGDIADIWESGRSVEYVAGVHEGSGLHSDYARFLSAYDLKVQAAAAQKDAGPGGLRQVLSYGLNLALGAVVVAGLAALLRSGEEQAC